MSEPVTKTVRSSTFCSRFEALVARGVGKDRSGKHAGHDKNCSAGSYQRLHKLTYMPGRCGAQIIETMTVLHRTKAREAMAVATTSPQTQPNVRVRISSLGARKRNGR